MQVNHPSSSRIHPPIFPSSRIAIVALNSHLVDKDYTAFGLLTVENKLTKLKNRIINICKQLQQREPNAMWMIVWREHCITSETGESLTTANKQLYEAMLQEITMQYPQLTVIGGTILTKKTYYVKKSKQHALNKLNKIKDFFQNNCQWIKENEVINGWESGIKNEEKVLREAKELCVFPSTTFDLYRNTCLVLKGDEIGKQDKIALKDETAYETSRELKVFQPGNKHNAAAFYEQDHPKTGMLITYGIEICHEHQFSVLKKIYPNEKPLIHFVLSNYISLRLHHLHGYYALQLDSKYMPRLLYLGDYNDPRIPMLSMVFYQNNLLDYHDHSLQGPFDPIYPFEKQVIDLLDQFISLHKEYYASPILKLKNKFIEFSAETYKTNTHSFLVDLLLEWQSNILNIGRMFLKTEIKLAADLIHLIEQEQKNNPDHKDYIIPATSVSTSDSILLKEKKRKRPASKSEDSQPTKKFKNESGATTSSSYHVRSPTLFCAKTKHHPSDAQDDQYRMDLSSSNCPTIPTVSSSN